MKNMGFGVAALKWSPCGHYLWIAGRKHDRICCWDVRSSRSELGSIQRSLNTNQKMKFDIDFSGNRLCSGSQDGR